MVVVQHLLGPTSFPAPTVGLESLSVLSYNVLLPNSEDGWWNYKMYLPPLTEENKKISEWEYRRDLLRERISTVDADVVCLQEVSPLSFDDDFNFMADLGYDGKEMFKKGRFRPATFWKTSRLELVAPPVHKDRTLLVAFRRRSDDGSTASDSEKRNWYVLNCHLQAGKQGSRRVRQITEGIRSVMTLARKKKEKNPERNIPLIVCGDFNGGPECAAVRYLEDGFIDENFREDGEQVSSGRKPVPLEKPMTDVATTVVDRSPPSTLVVPELISTMVKGGAYENPVLSNELVDRLKRIYERLATHKVEGSGKVMNLADVEGYLTAINGKVGRGSEFRVAARQMGWKDESKEDDEDENDNPPVITLPENGLLTLDGFLHIYEAELKQGKFWGIAHDMAVLGEPVPDAGVFQSRYDRMYCSAAVQPVAVMDFVCSDPCPNHKEPSDHLPVAACFKMS